MKRLSSILIILCLFNSNAFAQDFGLKMGPYAVGVKRTLTHDYSRTYLMNYDDNGNLDKSTNPRPIHITCWYPAENSSTNSLPFSQYMVWDYKESKADGTPVSDADNTAAESLFKSHVRGNDAFQRLTSMQTNAHLEAAPIQKTFPAIIYAPSLAASNYDNAVLCEYLASHGYYVFSVPSHGQYQHQTPMNPSGLEAQARDIEFVIQHVSQLEHVDRETIGLAGFSWGGLSSLLVASRNHNIDAVVAFENSPASYASGHPHLVASNLYAPIMRFNGSAFNKTGNDQIVTEMRYADTWQIEINRFTHLDFSSLNLAIRNAKSGTAIADDTIVTGYKKMCRYSLEFMNQYLKHNKDSEANLKEWVQEDLEKKFLTNATFNRGTTPPMPQNLFIDMIGEQGVDKAIALYHTYKTTHPDYQLFQFQAMRDVGWQMGNRGADDDAIKIFMMMIDAFPTNAEGYARVGRVYEKLGKNKLAIEFYEKGIETDPDSVYNDASRRSLEKLKDK